MLHAGSESLLPKGWGLAGSNPKGYTVALDESIKKSGANRARLQAPSKTEGFGTLMQAVLADPYRGKRLELTGFIKSQDVLSYAGLWMRIDGPSHLIALDNMSDRPITGTTDWNRYSVVLDVPDNASAIAFGVLLNGSGQAWLDNVELKVVGPDVPVTREGRARGAMELVEVPINLDFDL